MADKYYTTYQAGKLRQEAKNILNSLMKIPEGYSSGLTERFVDCIISVAMLECVSFMEAAGLARSDELQLTKYEGEKHE